MLAFRPEAIFVEVGISERQIGNPMRNQIDFGNRNMEHFLENLRRLPAHDDQAVRQSCNFLHHGALIGIRLAEYRMQSGDDWYF